VLQSLKQLCVSVRASSGGPIRPSNRTVGDSWNDRSVEPQRLISGHAISPAHSRVAVGPAMGGAAESDQVEQLLDPLVRDPG
jgi:hypothetical protein